MSFAHRSVDDEVGFHWQCPDDASKDYELNIRTQPGGTAFTYGAVREMLYALDTFVRDWRMEDWVPSFDIVLEEKRQPAARATGSMVFEVPWWLVQV